MKTCKTCKKKVSIKLFSVAAGNKDGLKTQCKSCRSYLDSLYYKSNSSSIKERTSQYRKDHPEKQRQYHLSHWSKHPEKRSARVKVGNALAQGVLTRPKFCAIHNKRCEGKIEAHHNDYNAPLEVSWLCQLHHKTWHKCFIV